VEDARNQDFLNALQTLTARAILFVGQTCWACENARLCVPVSPVHQTPIAEQPITRVSVSAVLDSLATPTIATDADPSQKTNANRTRSAPTLKRVNRAKEAFASVCPLVLRSDAASMQFVLQTITQRNAPVRLPVDTSAILQDPKDAVVLNASTITTARPPAPVMLPLISARPSVSKTVADVTPSAWLNHTKPFVLVLQASFPIHDRKLNVSPPTFAPRNNDPVTPQPVAPHRADEPFAPVQLRLWVILTEADAEPTALALTVTPTAHLKQCANSAAV